MTTEVQTADCGWIRRVVIGRDPKRTLARLVIWVVSCLVIFKFMLLPIRVQGVSMLPTFKEGRVNFVNRLSYVFGEPRRGDTVAIRMRSGRGFWRTTGEHIMYLKRIIALPGETIEFRNGRVFINGEPLYEPYLKYPCAWDQPPEQIGPGEYYVVGDNRAMDFSEHYQGKAWRSQIVGKTLL